MPELTSTGPSHCPSRTNWLPTKHILSNRAQKIIQCKESTHTERKKKKNKFLQANLQQHLPRFGVEKTQGETGEWEESKGDKRKEGRGRGKYLLFIGFNATNKVGYSAHHQIH